jgi:hypothetical protein
VRWIEQYTQREYEQILYLLQTYEQGQLSFSGFISDLDELLHVWEKVTDDWGDPFLRKWTALENIYLKNPARGPVGEVTEHLLTEMIAELKKRIQRVYVPRYCGQALSAINAYDQGEVSLQRLATDLWKLLSGLELLLPNQWDLLQTQLRDLDEAVEYDTYYQEQGLVERGWEDRHQSRVNGALAEIRQLLRETITTVERRSG